MEIRSDWLVSGKQPGKENFFSLLLAKFWNFPRKKGKTAVNG